MKLFALFLALTVLLQGFLPCSDTDFGWSKGNVKTELSEASHQQDKEKGDDCSPFCQCACCAGFSINHCIAAIGLVSEHASKAYTEHLPSETIDIPLPIWQPPQLIS
ncbi:MAG: hypothetical protein EOO06_14395 [Chitinophagaceae bacterium]|nr:hypothetical protein [Flavisolibacter longurius]RYY46485.1 MAG: hypothetical protein EOO06_14395 [Chitinophagaceae bacterium]